MIYTLSEILEDGSEAIIIATMDIQQVLSKLTDRFNDEFIVQGWLDGEYKYIIRYAHSFLITEHCKKGYEKQADEMEALLVANKLVEVW